MADATCRLGVAEWNGRETIRENLRAFIDTVFTAHHDVVEYWTEDRLNIFRGISVSLTTKPYYSSKPTVKPVMTHFFYMDEADPIQGSQLDRIGSGPSSSSVVCKLNVPEVANRQCDWLLLVALLRTHVIPKVTEPQIVNNAPFWSFNGLEREQAIPYVQGMVSIGWGREHSSAVLVEITQQAMAWTIR